ncbi:MAG: ABC transporter permease [Lachnospiraceae bacterium]|nr:ABC transporter permease [Lachnospiraceae bacterium]
MAKEKMEEKEIKPEEMQLDDAARVKVLSPGMMVAKRFFRNRLAIVGMVIIICMFLFSFLGGALSPYSESEVFYTSETMLKDYAGATAIDQYLFVVKPGEALPKDIYSKTMIAASTNKFEFTSRDGNNYRLEPLGEEVYVLYARVQTGPKPKDVEDVEIAIGSLKSFTTASADMELSYDFCKGALSALASGQESFSADGADYKMEAAGNHGALIMDASGAETAFVSDMNINPVNSGTYLSPGFKLLLIEMIEQEKDSMSVTEDDGTEATYLLQNKNGQYLVRRNQETRIIDSYAAPSPEHVFGTDGNGMDLMARLMYGGRISLLIGFVVIAIEVVIGTIIGGIAGFFGGRIDNLLMRLVDVIYCIPSLPLFLILGSIMDYYQLPAKVRIYTLCVVLAVIGWVGIARIVRGQILSLREQEFMIATEALGLSTHRRIFRHLVPNVIPQLIVFASMGLGDVILTEATLSFLGMGIKYPAASWGSIINAVNDVNVMTNYVFVWLPAGMFILLTVLAFNFIGDGLRDAFDPKMKR